MRTDELEIRTRMSAFIGDVAQFPDYTQAWVLNELTDQVHLLFERAVVNARAGYWLQQSVVPVVSGTARYQIPARSVVGGIMRVDIADATLDWQTLPEVDDQQAQNYDLATGMTGPVQCYVMRGDQIQLLPVPDATVTNLRISYAIRPSRLVPQQSSTLNSGTIRGLISNVNTGARTITVNVVPFDQELAVPAAITSALQRIDVVRGNGWHEVKLVSAAQTLSGLVFTVGGTDDMTGIAVGDYVRAEQQTDWPALPDDFHRCVCDAAAVKILTQLAWFDKAKGLVQQLDADLQRFQDLITPRARESARDIVMPFELYGSGRRSVAKYP